MTEKSESRTIDPPVKDASPRNQYDSNGNELELKFQKCLKNVKPRFSKTLVCPANCIDHIKSDLWARFDVAVRAVFKRLPGTAKPTVFAAIMVDFLLLAAKCLRLVQ